MTKKELEVKVAALESEVKQLRNDLFTLSLNVYALRMPLAAPLQPAPYLTPNIPSSPVIICDQSPSVVPLTIGAVGINRFPNVMGERTANAGDN